VLKRTPRKNWLGRRAWPALALALAMLAAGGLPALAQDTQLKFVTKNVADGTVGLPYKSAIQLTGGTPPYKWQLGGGSSLPPGLVLKKLKGKIVGIPTTLGTFTFTVRATDSAGGAQNRDFTITIGDTTELVELVSVSTTGTAGNSDSGGAAVSPDGRFVAFTSFASNLVVGDKNGHPDVFLRDRTCGTTVLASVSAAGIPAKGQSLAPWISAVVGSTVFVTYRSDAPNLVADDTNNLGDIFVTAFDVSACPPVVVDTARVSVGLDSNGDPVQSKGLSNLPVISTDGRFVAYHSQGASLVEGDSNGAFDIFLTEIQFSGGVISVVRTQRLSTRKSLLGVPLMVNLGDTPADISGNRLIGNSTLTMAVDEHKGRVAMIVAGTGVGQGRLIDSNTATTLTMTTGWAINPDTTSVFRVVTREKTADIFSASTIGHSGLAMTPGEHVGRQVEIFAGTGHDKRRLITANDATTLTVTPDWDPVPDDTSAFRVVTETDHSVDFADERNLASFNLASGLGELTNRLLEIISGTGVGQVRVIVTNDPISIFVEEDWDPIPDSTSVFRVYTQGTGNSFRPRLTPDGSLVAFHSDNALASEDTNVVPDVYLADPPTGLTFLQSMDDAGTVANGPSNISALSGDANLVLFNSSATKLVPDDDNVVSDLFLHDRTAGTTVRVSLANDGSEGDGFVDVAAGLSGGGRLVAFSSLASNLVADDRNDARDIFLRDLLAPSTTRLSLGMGGINPNSESFDTAMSLDGTTVVFTSAATNLVANDTTKTSDIYLVTTGISDPPIIVVSTLPTPRRGAPYTATLAAVGGTAPLFWTLTEGALPPGLFLDPSTGTISGLSQRTGSYSFTVAVMDSDRPTRQASRTLTLVVRP
jgi:Tol biopolymer transport system component